MVQLQDEAEQQRAKLEQTKLDKDSELSNLREELLNQTQQLDSCQARVSTNTHTVKNTLFILLDMMIATENIFYYHNVVKSS